MAAKRPETALPEGVSLHRLETSMGWGRTEYSGCRQQFRQHAEAAFSASYKQNDGMPEFGPLLTPTLR